MKTFHFLTLAGLAGVGTFSLSGESGQGPLSLKKAVAGRIAPPPASRAAASTSLGVGTVVTSNSYPLLAHTQGRVKRLYFDTGQRVRKGQILLKFYDYSFIVAPADGIVTQRMVEPSVYLNRTSPVAQFIELYPFRIRLAAGAVHSPLRPGQVLLVQSAQYPVRHATGVVVSSSGDDQSLLVEMRLQTPGPEPVPVGAQVQVSALPANP